jgi:hypothetical protein
MMVTPVPIAGDRDRRKNIGKLTLLIGNQFVEQQA